MCSIYLILKEFQFLRVVTNAFPGCHAGLFSTAYKYNELQCYCIEREGNHESCCTTTHSFTHVFTHVFAYFPACSLLHTLMHSGIQLEKLLDFGCDESRQRGCMKAERIRYVGTLSTKNFMDIQHSNNKRMIHYDVNQIYGAFTTIMINK